MDYFNNQQFEIRKQAVKYILDIYGVDKNIVQSNKKKRSSYIICLQCDNSTCGFIITCTKSRSNNSDGYFIYEQENSFLQHGGANDFCTSVGKLSTVS